MRRGGMRMRSASQRVFLTRTSASSFLIACQVAKCIRRASMKKKFLVLAGAGVAALGLSQAAQAALIPTTTSSTSSWLGTPVYKTGPAPTTGNGGTTQDNDSWGGNANGLNGFGALAMTFEVSQAGTLGAVQLSMAGSPQLFNVELYDMGSASTYAYSTAGGNVGITQINGLGQEPSNTAEI